MTTHDLMFVLVAFGLVLLNGWFVLAEFSLVRVRTTRLKKLAEEGSRSAARALHITQKLDAYLSVTQLGITLASLALGWVGEPAIARLIRPIFEGIPASRAFVHGFAVTVAFFIITFLHVVLGEQAPKFLAIQKSDVLAPIVARPLHYCYLVLYPLMFVLRGATNWLVRVLGLRGTPSETAEAHSEEELRMIVAASHRHGILDESTRDLLDNVFDYTERIAREIMTPRRDVVCIDVHLPVEPAIALAIEKEYTRYPLVDGATDRVIGFVHIKDLVSVTTGRRRVTTLQDVARQPLFVPETASIDKVRRQLQARRTHFGIVVDEFGDFTGIVTLEDLLEELVGDIQDELDSEQPRILRRPDGSAEVDAAILVDEASEKLGLHLTSEVEAVDTLGGFVFTVLGRKPVKGDAVTVGDHRLEVMQVDELRIRRLRVSRIGKDALTPPPAPPIA